MEIGVWPRWGSVRRDLSHHHNGALGTLGGGAPEDTMGLSLLDGGPSGGRRGVKHLQGGRRRRRQLVAIDAQLGMAISGAFLDRGKTLNGVCNQTATTEAQLQSSVYMFSGISHPTIPTPPLCMDGQS